MLCYIVNSINQGLLWNIAFASASSFIYASIYELLGWKIYLGNILFPIILKKKDEKERTSDVNMKTSFILPPRYVSYSSLLLTVSLIRPVKWRIFQPGKVKSTDKGLTTWRFLAQLTAGLKYFKITWKVLAWAMFMRVQCYFWTRLKFRAAITLVFHNCSRENTIM